MDSTLHFRATGTFYVILCLEPRYKKMSGITIILFLFSRFGMDPPTKFRREYFFLPASVLSITFSNFHFYFLNCISAIAHNQ